ncbi:MAG: ribbon-helix-helix protein, CopG family [Blastochloris sp.]|nr:ribbon-helix-helix protein, CopG family [Blastochloris sp.]
MVTLSIKVPPTQKARLDTLARQRKTTVSHLMRQALEGLSQESAQIGTSSCYDLVHDLFDLPSRLGASHDGDRSTNKRHLDSFGKSTRP